MVAESCWIGAREAARLSSLSRGPPLRGMATGFCAAISLNEPEQLDGHVFLAE